MRYIVGKNSPPKHTQFKKGTSGNPDGARRRYQVERAIGQIDSSEFTKFGWMTLNSTVRELKAFSRDKRISIYKVTIVQSLLKDIQRCRTRTLALILDRLIGKLPKRTNSEVNSSLWELAIFSSKTSNIR